MTSFGRALMRDLDAVLAGVDDPTLLGQFAGDGREPKDVMMDIVRDLKPEDAKACLDAILAPHEAIVMFHTSHPCFTEILDYCRVREGVIVLASASGPPPNAVIILEGPRHAG